MASLMESLIMILKEESLLYQNLLELSTRKTPVIIAGDLTKLTQITDDEQIVVSKINHLDTKRLEVLNDIANVINKDVSELKLANLIEMLESRSDEQQKLAQVHDELQDVVYQVVRVNEQNRELIQSSLEMVEFDLNMMQAMKTAPETANYNKTAYNTGSSMGVGTSGFDAKQ